jgi:hypothetical protein
VGAGLYALTWEDLYDVRNIKHEWFEGYPKVRRCQVHRFQASRKEKRAKQVLFTSARNSLFIDTTGRLPSIIIIPLMALSCCMSVHMAGCRQGLDWSKAKAGV